MSLKVITPPASEPLSADEAKKYLRIDGTDDDTIITSLITQAREWCEDYQGKKFITQTLELILDEFPTQDYIEFKACSPVQSVATVKYYDTDNTENTFDSSNYFVDTDSFVNRIVLGYLKTWPTTTLRPANAVAIRFDAGYGGASTVPESVKLAMVCHMKLLGDGILFNLRPEDRKDLERARNALLGMRRVMLV